MASNLEARSQGLKKKDKKVRTVSGLVGAIGRYLLGAPGPRYERSKGPSDQDQTTQCQLGLQTRTMPVQTGKLLRNWLIDWVDPCGDNSRPVFSSHSWQASLLVTGATLLVTGALLVVIN